MKLRLIPLVLVAGLLLAFGAIAAACGDDGDNGNGEELTLEEYFQQLDAIFEDTDSQIDALEDPEEMDLTSEEEQLEAMRDFFDALLAIIQGTFSEMEGLDPPAEVEDAHDALLAAGADSLAAFEDSASQLAEAESLADLLELFDDGGFEAVSERSEQTCLELQDIAADNNITVDLQCSE